MAEHDILQWVIAICYTASTVTLAANRFIVGCFIGLPGTIAWWLSASAHGQWGIQLSAVIAAIIFVLGIIGRWPRRAKPSKDEHAKNLGIG